MTDPPTAWVRTDDGVDLALWRVPPERPSHRPPVLLVHGTFSNRRFFHGTADRGLARELARRGFDAWVAELRGHGRSGAAGRGEAWQFEDWIRHDAPALVRGVLAHTGAERLLWVGHSAGGVIGVALLGLAGPEAARVAGLVMVGAPAPTGLGMMQRPIAAAGYVLARLFGRFPARLLGIGPEDEHLGIFAQWMRWNLRGEWHGADGTDYFANCRRVRAPVLALAGGGDWLIAPPAVCEDLLDACGSDDRMFIACGRAEGFAEDYDHNRVLVSTPARTDVWPLIADWLETPEPVSDILLLDYNGVIAHDEPVHYAAFREVLQSYHLDLDEATYTADYLGLNDRSAFVEAWRRANRTVTPELLRLLMGEKAEAYRRRVAGGVPLVPGVQAFLQDAAARWPLAVVSGALRAEIDAGLTGAGLRALVRVVVAEDDIATTKPDPAGFRLALRQLAALGARADRALVIEDSLPGLGAARALGAGCVMLSTAHPRAALRAADAVWDDFTGHTAAELVPLFRAVRI